MASMQVASMLSDLTSLQVCDPDAAKALVSARPSKDDGAPNGVSTKAEPENDVDLKRAKDLLELHASIKLARSRGLDRELQDARQRVERVLQTL